MKDNYLKSLIISFISRMIYRISPHVSRISAPVERVRMRVTAHRPPSAGHPMAGGRFRRISLSLLLNMAALLPGLVSRAQTILPESLLGYDHFTDPVVAVVTNRVRTSDGVFLNEVDTTSPLAVYRVEYSDGSLSVVPSSLRAALNSGDTSCRDLVVFVHGDGKTFDHAAVRGLDIRNTYGVKVLVFAWPSRRDDGRVVNNFKTSLTNLQQGMGHFNALLDSVRMLKATCGIDHVTLFFHSLGNQYVPWWVGQYGSDSSSVFIDNLVLNAGAVNSRDHAQWVEKLNIQDRIFINSNARDLNLNGLRIISSYGYLLGELLLPPLASNAYYVNFSDAIGPLMPPGRSHTYYVGEHPAASEHIRQYYNDLFHGRMPSLDDPAMFVVRKDGFGRDIVY